MKFKHKQFQSQITSATIFILRIVTGMKILKVQDKKKFQKLWIMIVCILIKNKKKISLTYIFS